MDARIKSGHDDSRAMRLARLISGEHAHDVGFLHDQEFLTVELDLGARPLAEQHTVADPKVDRDQLAGFVTAARTDRRDLTLRRLFLWKGSVFRVWSAVESGSEYGRIRHRQGAKQLAILSNRALGVLIVRPGIWLDADPVKQPGYAS